MEIILFLGSDQISLPNPKTMLHLKTHDSKKLHPINKKLHPINKKVYLQKQILHPSFISVFKKDKKNTSIYKSYIQYQITKVTSTTKIYIQNSFIPTKITTTDKR